MLLEHLFVEVKFTNVLVKVLELSFLTSVYTFCLYLIFIYIGQPHWPWLDKIEGGFAAIVGALLIFRTNRAYERWWEARSLWGTLINVSRNLAIKIKNIIKPSPQEAKKYAELITQFSQALAIHLRNNPSCQSLQAILKTKTLPEHVPAYIANKIYQKVYQNIPENKEIDKLIIDHEMRELMNVCGGCEKIKTTFISISYRMFIKHLILFFIIIMPLGLIDNIGLYSIPMVLFTSYIMLALEAIARNLEEPFGSTDDHIQLCEINAQLKKSIDEIFAL